MAAVLSLALAACGGGSGTNGQGSSTNDPPPPPSAPVLSAAPAPTYADQVRADAFNVINAERLKAGLGALTQSTELDVAAGYDSNYFLLNPSIPVGFVEDEGNPGYVFDSPRDRIAQSGYSASSYGITYTQHALAGADAALVSLATPYHRVWAMDYTWSQMGFGLTVDSDGDGVLVNDLALPNGGTAQGMTSTVSVYPADKSTDISVLMPNEVPTYPLPQPWGPGAYPGYPVSVQLNKADMLVWIPGSFTLKEATSGATVAGTVLDNGSSVLDAYGMRNWAFFIPTTPLKPATTYTASFNATIEGSALSKNWSFTTRAATVSVSNVPTSPIANGLSTTVKVQSTALLQTVDPVSLSSQCGGAQPQVTAGPGAVRLKLVGGTISTGCVATVTVHDLAYAAETASFNVTFAP